MSSRTDYYEPKRELGKTMAIAIGLAVIFAVGLVLTLAGLSV